MKHESQISGFDELMVLINSEEFDRAESHCLASNVPQKCLKGPCVLGVDEAGRGPVLGPMVYAVCYCPKEDIEIIETIGCTDSKALTAKKRKEIFELISNTNDEIGWAADIISPNYISNKMLQRNKCSLNEIAQNSTINLLESILNKNIDLSEIFIDTIGPPEKYQAKLSQLFPKCKITVEKKADSLYPVVGAASICAKVIRDSVVENWKFAEAINVTEQEFGTGYPGDPKSRQFLTENSDDIFGFSNFVRFSWSTAEKLLENKTKIIWEEENEENGTENTIKKFFNNLGPSGEPKHKSTGVFFQERSLTGIDKF